MPSTVRIRMKSALLILMLCSSACAVPQDTSATTNSRPRARDAGIVIGTLPTGKHNAITDVIGVRVGHATIVRGEDVRTGVTVIQPHGGNLYQEKVPAAIFVMNGYGKLVGSTQVAELGELESPIALTNTLNVGKVMDAMVGYMLGLPGNENVRSVNVVVGETNDGRLNDIRGRHVSASHVAAALKSASAGAVIGDAVEGAVGAGTGTMCFGWKGGIGTSSRRAGDHTVGVLVQTNFGGSLTIAGEPVHKSLSPRRGRRPRKSGDPDPDDGSCMIVVATDAPLSARILGRLARRAIVGMARTGASFSNGSGDYVIAFSTAEKLRIRPGARVVGAPVLANGQTSRLFRAVAEATEEAILNSLFAAVTTTGSGRTARALPIDAVKKLVAR
jgi:D-aminopeptidase